VLCLFGDWPPEAKSRSRCCPIASSRRPQPTVKDTDIDIHIYILCLTVSSSTLNSSAVILQILRILQILQGTAVILAANCPFARLGNQTTSLPRPDDIKDNLTLLSHCHFSHSSLTSFARLSHFYSHTLHRPFRLSSTNTPESAFFHLRHFIHQHQLKWG
jgi:hypothetical protein